MIAEQKTPDTSSNILPRPRWRIPIAVVALLFGLATVKSGGSVLFVDGPDRAAAGAYVPFVLWFNFMAGFLYIATAIAIYLWTSWAARAALVIATLTIAVFGALGVHILMDGAFEMRTVYAMTLRSFVWVTFAFLLSRAMPAAPTDVSPKG